MLWLRSLLPAILAAIATLLLTPLARKLAIRLRAMDVPGGRKQHDKPIPRLGGLAIAGGIVVALGPCLFLLAPQTLLDLGVNEIVGFTLATTIIFALGLADDIAPVSPLVKLIFQLLAASIVVGIGWQFTALRLPFDERIALGAVAPLLSIFWIVGVTNAINFVDGLDGLAAGIVAIISFSLLILATLQGRPEIVVLASCMAGACIGFLRHNWRPATIYMGDSGSLTLGFILASITLRTSFKGSTAIAIIVPLLALGLPVIDTLMVMLYRFLRGHPTLGRIAGVFYGDRKHLHHLLLETRVGRPFVIAAIYGLVLAFCVMALTVAASSSWRLGVAFLFVEFAIVFLIRRAGLAAEARRLANRHLDDLSRPDRLPADS